MIARGDVKYRRIAESPGNLPLGMMSTFQSSPWSRDRGERRRHLVDKCGGTGQTARKEFGS